MKYLVRLIVNALAVLAAAYLVSGVHVQSFWIALIVALFLAILNATLKPILLFITLPINVLTLGLFTLIINTLMTLLVSFFIPGFTFDNLLSALVFSFVLSVINWVLSLLK